MDTTETYAKMCEKAEEIQEKMIYPLGSFYHENDLVINNAGDYYHQTKGSNIPGYIWLPRQDQLQEMLMLNIPQEEIFYFLRDFTLGHLKKYPESWEQIWLIAVMKTKFNKIWNGEEWIK